MIRLLEDDTKAWLRGAGMPVPEGAAAATPAEAARIAASMDSSVVVKALVPAGRRGQAGAVRHATTAEEASAAASTLLGAVVGDYVVREVYVEKAITIARELYCAFLFDDEGPRVVVSTSGGVDIEASAQRDAEAIRSMPVDPLSGMPQWRAIDLWKEAGAAGPLLRALGDVTARLYALFVSGDVELLEINPLAVDDRGHLVLVGAMAGIDDSAASRHAAWRDSEHRVHPVRPRSPREARVMALDAALPGSEARYVELDGDIGLLVGGGGAGLYQHDRMLAAGGRPANHCVTPPTGADNRKLRAVIDAILEHPTIRALLVGFNFAQMARADVRVATLLDAIDARRIDTARFPVVIRLFGAGEAEARARVAGRPGIHYLPREASLDDAVRLVVSLAAGARRL
jgi:succinyl-CoA synthetase beta subunit